MVPDAEELTAFVPLPFTLCEATFWAVMTWNGSVLELTVVVNGLWTATETVFGVISTLVLEK
jgi:hypothetical protein